jgi:hypothetical protein
MKSNVALLYVRARKQEKRNYLGSKQLSLNLAYLGCLQRSEHL